MSTPAQARRPPENADMLQAGSASLAAVPGTSLVNPADDGSFQFLSQGGVLSAMATMVMDSLAADGLCVAYAEQGRVVCRASCGGIAPAVGTPLNVNSGIGAQCLREGKTTTCADTETDPRVNREVCRRIGIRSILAVPLRLNSAVIGIAQAFYAAPNGFSQANILELEQSARLFVSVLPIDAREEEEGEISSGKPQNVTEAPANGLTESSLAASHVELPVEEFSTVVSAQEAPFEGPDQKSPGEPRLVSEAAPAQTTSSAETLTPQASKQVSLQSVDEETSGVLNASPKKLAAETAFASFAPMEEPAWWKRATVPVVALSAVLALLWVVTHSSFHPLVPDKPANTLETPDKAAVESSSPSVAQLQNKAGTGDSNAQVALAKRYETGKGVSRNLTKAYSWYILAAEAGNDAARQAIRPLTSKLTAAQIAAVRFEVARMYANGIGARTRDPIAAFAWMVLAEAAGDRRAKAEQNILAASMSPQEIAQAQTRASYWLKSRGYSTPYSR